MQRIIINLTCDVRIGACHEQNPFPRLAWHKGHEQKVEEAGPIAIEGRKTAISGFLYWFPHLYPTTNISRDEQILKTCFQSTIDKSDPA